MKNQMNNNLKIKYSLLATGILGIIIFLMIGTFSTVNSTSAKTEVINTEETHLLLSEEVTLENVHNILPVFEDIVATKETSDELTVTNAEAVIEPAELPVEEIVETESAVETIQVVSEPIVEEPAFNGPSYDMIDYYANNFYQLANDYPDWYWMSRIIYAESEGEIQEGQIAVGNVILNRVKSKHFANTIYDVIHQKGQFSPVGTRRMQTTPNRMNIESAYKVLYQGAKAEGMTDNVLYFRSDVARWWRGVYYWKTIGGHHFAKYDG